MEKKLSVWCKSAKIEMIRRDIKTTTLAKNLGMNRSYVSSILNGRVYSGPAVKRIFYLLLMIFFHLFRHLLHLFY